MKYKSRGHFCNYCRTITFNRVVKPLKYAVISINTAIWYAWDHPEIREQFVSELSTISTDLTNKQYNSQLKALMERYGGICK